MARQTVPFSGLWSAIAGLINSMFTEVYQYESFGVYDYNDATTQSTPIDIAASATWYALTNDGAGPNTNKTYALPTVADIWNTTTNAFDFTGLALGDTVDIRLDVEVTTDNNNQDVDIDLFVADGEVGEYTLPFVIERNFKTAGAHRILVFSSVYMGDANTRDNAARFKVRSSGTGDVKVNGWYCRAMKRAQEEV